MCACGTLGHVRVSRLWKYRSPRRGIFWRNAMRRRVSRRRPRRKACRDGEFEEEQRDDKDEQHPDGAQTLSGQPQLRPRSKNPRNSKASTTSPRRRGPVPLPEPLARGGHRPAGDGVASRPGWLGGSARAAVSSGERGAGPSGTLHLLSKALSDVVRVPDKHHTRRRSCFSSAGPGGAGRTNQ